MARLFVRSANRPSWATVLVFLCLAGAPSLAQEPAPPVGQADAGGAAAAALLPSADEHELRYAQALALARRGDLVRATAALQALLACAPQAELARHIESDLERIRLFQALRAKQLAELAATGGALRLQLDGRELSFIVQTLEEERVVFRNSVFGIRSLPLAKLDSLQLAKQMSRDLDGATSRWVRLYPYLLTDEERGRQLLRRDCRDLDEAASLLADAEQWYPAVLELLDVCTLLEQLAQAANEGAAAPATLEQIQRLLTRHGELEAVQQRLPQLQALATACLESSHQVQDLLAGLSGSRKRLADGTVRLAYDFDQPDELADFRQVPGYPPERIAALPALKVRAGQVLFEPRKGELAVAGCVSWRHVLTFEGPTVVRCRLRVEAAPAGGSPACFWMIGACDDGQQSYVALQELGTVMALDPAHAFVAYAAAEPSRRLSLDAFYDLELDCDGEKVRTRVNGEFVREVPAGGLRRGEVFFLVHSDAALHIDRIEIDVAPGGLTSGTAWIAAKLCELGFPAAAPATAPAETGVQ